MTKKLLILLLILIPFKSYSYDRTPNPNIAPGELCSRSNRDFDGYRYAERIPHCKRKVSKGLKRKVCARQGVSDSERRKNYTVDHIIPLSIGGSNSGRNLWCQHKSIHSGDVEFWLFKELRDGHMNQSDSIDFILDYKFNPSAQRSLLPELLLE